MTPVPTAARHRGAIALIAVLLVAVTSTTFAQSTVPRIEQVEAAYLVNFVRYTEWPADRFAGGDSPYFIDVIGDAALADAIAGVATAAPPINGRRVVVRRIRCTATEVAALTRCLAPNADGHVLFIGNSESERVAALLAHVRNRPVLTVSDIEGFADFGGMLGLFVEGRHVAFAANPAAIRNAGLLVSAKVLKLARIVDTEPP